MHSSLSLFYLHVADEEEDSYERDGWETISMDGQIVSIRTSTIDEKYPTVPRLFALRPIVASRMWMALRHLRGVSSIVHLFGLSFRYQHEQGINCVMKDNHATRLSTIKCTTG
ncbi:hypothetical protein EV363DRAFT_126354 [Boletus edulis]|uniref:Uncharacterized protein n=1 Tax=Boletus edulis BED1 TaxID=1328754 RepID=A0AAD4BCG8_BOLED|nr:hypothetical protein EV363DRAFT_126354 [Boletus edulis]KAF8417610.1 hypothetical protein L210DRAFT_2472612 [Boletus edulis BED1]KAF8425358.1 hypothetical protein L210DRAFT_73910 [Boletus edulis BED1]